jgi:hypothetical protein
LLKIDQCSGFLNHPRITLQQTRESEAKDKLIREQVALINTMDAPVQDKEDEIR